MVVSTLGRQSDSHGKNHAWFLLAVILAVFWGVGITVRTARSEDWPAWRGARGDGLSGDKALPVTWEPERGIAWKTAIPGRGHSSPIVCGQRVFITSALEKEQRRMLYCLDFHRGRVLWERTVLTAPLEGIHQLNSYASSTPATDGETVFVTFLDGKQMYVAAYDNSGNKRWECRPGVFSSKHGFCTNPVLYRDQLIVNGDHDGDSYLAMLRKSDGGTVWKTPREHRTRSYCTPIIIDIDGQDQLLLSGSYRTAGYDVQTGQRIWACNGPSEQMVATLVHNRDMIFSLGGYPERHLLAIRKGGKGEITDTHIAWRTHKAIPYVPSPLLYGNFLHVVSDEGIYTCFDPPTGKVHTTRRVATHVSSSIVGGGDKVFITDDAGVTTVLENGPSFTVIAKNSLGERVFSTPALVADSILIRGEKHLFRIGKENNARANR